MFEMQIGCLKYLLFSIVVASAVGCILNVLLVFSKVCIARIQMAFKESSIIFFELGGLEVFCFTSFRMLSLIVQHISTA